MGGHLALQDEGLDGLSDDGGTRCGALLDMIASRGTALIVLHPLVDALATLCY